MYKFHRIVINGLSLWHEFNKTIFYNIWVCNLWVTNGKSSETNVRPLHNTGGTILDIHHTAPISLYPLFTHIMQGRALHSSKLSQKMISKITKIPKNNLKNPPKKSEKSENLFFKSSESRNKISFKFLKNPKTLKTLKK